MASSSGSGTSSGSTVLTNPSSEEDLKALMDQRKRKRMISNRESARRSRMRKQKHLEDVIAQAESLRLLNQQIGSRLNQTIQQYLTIEAENSVLRAQVDELSHRLQALDEICSLNNTRKYGSSVHGDDDCHWGAANVSAVDGFSNSWHLQFLNHQPIIVSGDMPIQY